MRYLTVLLVCIVLIVLSFQLTRAQSPLAPHSPDGLRAKYVILMIGDGMGDNQARAANLYAGSTPAYQSWTKTWTATYESGGSYDATQAWTDFNYVTSGATESASAATTLYTGVKTSSGRIGVSADGATRLYSIADKARSLGLEVGAVTSVYLSHATPGAWFAHNDSRVNGFAIADEGLWGDPNTTGNPTQSTYYSGGHGNTSPPVDVAIGAGHPNWGGGTYINMAIRDKLFNDMGTPGAFTFVERIAGSADGGTRLTRAASTPTVTRLASLFGGSNGNLEYRLANGSGANAENPTLAEMTAATLTVLSRDPDGFVLLGEGGAIDWAAHANNMDQLIGEMIDFNNAVQTVIDWVDDPANDSTWANTLVIVTGDHEAGYLTAAPGIFPDQPLGTINATTLALEKAQTNGRRASWVDTDNDNVVDTGEIAYWAWNSGSHTNSLIPLYAKGAGEELFANYVAGTDPVRGSYVDNSAVFYVMNSVTEQVTPTPTPTRTSTPTATPLPTEAILGSCSDWVQVNDGAFGIPSNFDAYGTPITPTPTKAYNGEEGFELIAFNGQLYLGMEADDKYGARLWRSKAATPVPPGQSSWEEVAADGSDYPFGNSTKAANDPTSTPPVLKFQNDHVDSLALFDGYLYASTANGGSTLQGTVLYRSASGAAGSWQQVNTAGFGDVNNSNFKDMQVFRSWLCGGTQNWTTGAQVWCTQDGTTWTQKNNGGFGASGNDNTTVEVWSGIEFEGALYFGVQNTGALRNDSSDDTAKIFRTTDLSATPTWIEVYAGAAGSYRADLLGSLNGYLYMATFSGGGVVIYRSDNGDSGSWAQVSDAGMDGNAQNWGTIVDGAAVYNGALYVGITNTTAGVELWRTRGLLSGNNVDWTQVDSSGLGDANNLYAELIPYNGLLYAWTSNYQSGQQVRRAKCPVCQKVDIAASGTYDFNAVGATLNFTSENLDSVVVCVYPEAFPSGQSSGKPVQRHYDIFTTPAAPTFNADLTLSYSDSELAASDISSESSLYLTRWTGTGWSACANPTADPTNNRVTCPGVTAFSPWAIAGSGGAPTAVSLAAFLVKSSPLGWPILLLGAILLIGLVGEMARR